MDLQHIQKTERLTDAFRIFNELSENLANSYQGLEEQVARLTNELAAARSERVKTLVEKEKLATRLQQILAALPAAVIVLNAGGVVIDCNHRALAFLGEPLLGGEWSAVVARSMQTVAGSSLERQLTDGRQVTITRSLLSDDAGQIILLSDVSELRSLQDMLAQQKHLTAMGEMVASLAHQIRTPLATAILYASQLSKPTLGEDKHRQFSRKIMERLHYLERQVNDMLIFAKQGRLAMQSFSIAGLLTQIQESMESFSGCFAMESRLQTEMLLGNEDALFGALMNLLDNAAEAGANRIAFTARQNDGDCIRIDIEDDGQGIDALQRQRLFEPFYTTKCRGTGLGLAVVDSVVKAHSGAITCSSAPGLGATFSIILPCTRHDGLSLSAVRSTEEKNHEAV